MRVIAGIRKGLKLNAPSGMDTRPTTDRVKESVFNIIQTYLPSGRVLDLFAGSGALGIEALSRRTERCVFVEHDRASFNLVKQNVALAKFEDSSEIIFSDSLSYLDTKPSPFDIIFLDPPYNKGYISKALDKIVNQNLLNSDGIVVVETQNGGEGANHPLFKTLKCAIYGKTIITILKQNTL